MPEQRRNVFFISDGTGITAETLGHSLLVQFEGMSFTQEKLPFIDSVAKAEECRGRLEESLRTTGTRPIVFSTLVDSAARETLRNSDALVLDFFEHFLDPLEAEFQSKSTHTIGRGHTEAGNQEYQDRIEAINFALAHDDGLAHLDLHTADVILIGVSRSGKTPTCLYMALQLGIKAANCPLIPEDFERDALPEALQPHVKKLFGLTITPDRLTQIRNERRPGSKYASIENCRYEIGAADALMKRHSIPTLNSTTKSIEEIATKILQEIKLQRRVY